MSLFKDFTSTPIAPGSTPKVEGILMDQDGNPLPGLILSSFTLTIVDTISGTVVNGISDQNILNTGRGSIDASGAFVIQLQTADTGLITSTDQIEYRSLIVIWTWNSGALIGKKQFDILIDRLARDPP